MPTFPCHGADARCEGGRAGWSSSSGSAHVDINNTKGEVPCSTAPGLLLQLPEALLTTKHAQELCRLIGLILKTPPTSCCFPSLGAAGKRNEEEDLPFPPWRGGEVGTHRVRQPWTMLHPITTFHHWSQGGRVILTLSVLLCHFLLPACLLPFLPPSLFLSLFHLSLLGCSGAFAAAAKQRT